MITTIDSHTCDEPTRIVTGGIINVPGQTMAEKKTYMERELDYIRTSLMREPRGHSNMFGAIITAPTVEEADLGVVFMDTGGYLNMCGHGSIGVATAAVETGMVTVAEPVTTVSLDTPAGLVKTRVRVEKGCVKYVSMENVPSFLYKQDLKIKLSSGELMIDIAFGGNFFAIVRAKNLSLELKTSNLGELIKRGLIIREEINQQVKVEHPKIKHINRVDLVEICAEPVHSEADQKNVVVFGDGQADRSPCGTGTCACMATWYSKGKLRLGEEFVNESIIGTLFRGHIKEETKIGNFKAVIPEIRANAYITGFNQWVIDPNDPLKNGFSC